MWRREGIELRTEARARPTAVQKHNLRGCCDTSDLFDQHCCESDAASFSPGYRAESANRRAGSSAVREHSRRKGLEQSLLGDSCGRHRGHLEADRIGPENYRRSRFGTNTAWTA